MRYSAVGLEMGICVTIGWAVGAWLDGKWRTDPWLTVTGVLLGVAAAFLGLFRAARRATRDIE